LSQLYLSTRAETDLLNIGSYTLDTWNAEQAARYLGEIRKCCARLAENPRLGRLSEGLHPGLRRMEQGSHVIFYRQIPDGILVSRILHRNMLPQLHPLDEG